MVELAKMVLESVKILLTSSDIFDSMQVIKLGKFSGVFTTISIVITIAIILKKIGILNNKSI